MSHNNHSHEEHEEEHDNSLYSRYGGYLLVLIFPLAYLLGNHGPFAEDLPSDHAPKAEIVQQQKPAH